MEGWRFLAHQQLAKVYLVLKKHKQNIEAFKSFECFPLVYAEQAIPSMQIRRF